LVFIDETWAKTNMTRTHGRALRGQRLVAAVWKRIGSLLDQFSPSECANYIKHAGYDQN
jgi:hypothetical protein